MKQRIHVSEEDIQVTKQGDPMACMVWRAVTRNLQLETQTGTTPITVSVDYEHTTFSGPTGHVTVKHSARTGTNIRKFDQDRDLVEPFDFDLDLPDDWREQVAGMTR